MGVIVHFTEILLEAWGYSSVRLSEGGNPIQPCEAAMPLVGTIAFQKILRGRRVLFYLDNAASLHTFVRGKSQNATVERAAMAQAFLALALQAHFWFEFVESKCHAVGKTDMPGEGRRAWL